MNNSVPSNIPSVTIYCDGACPFAGVRAQAGGWASITLYAGQETVRVGREKPCTNQRAELHSLLDALQALTRPCQVVFYSDSQYLVQGVNQWLQTWKKRGLLDRPNSRIANADLWRGLYEQTHTHRIQGVWIRGHLSPFHAERTPHHEYNDRCDQMAVQQSMRAAQESAP